MTKIQVALIEINFLWDGHGGCDYFSYPSVFSAIVNLEKNNERRDKSESPLRRRNFRSNGVAERRRFSSSLFWETNMISWGCFVTDLSYHRKKKSKFTIFEPALAAELYPISAPLYHKSTRYHHETFNKCDFFASFNCRSWPDIERLVICTVCE